MPERWVRNSQVRIHAVGVTFPNSDGTSRQQILRQFETSGCDGLELVREPQNSYGATAIAVFTPFGQVGYVAGEFSTQWAPRIDSGEARYTVGYTKVGEFEPEPGKQITTVEFDVDEWIWADRRGPGSGVQPPEQRSLVETDRKIFRASAKQPRRLIIWFLAIPIMTGLIRIAWTYKDYDRPQRTSKTIQPNSALQPRGEPRETSDEQRSAMSRTTSISDGDSVFNDNASLSNPDKMPQSTIPIAKNASEARQRELMLTADAKKREKLANSRLTATKGLKTVNPMAYKRRLREILEQFPESDAAKEADELLSE